MNVLNGDTKVKVVKPLVKVDLFTFQVENVLHMTST